MSSGIDDRAGVARPREVFVARAILGLTILATTVGVTFAILDAQGGNGGVVFATGVLSELPFLVAFVAFPIVGYLLASRRPDNAISWLLTGVGAAFAMDIFMGSYSTYALHGGVGGRGLGRLAAAIDGPMWVPIVGLPATFLILLFPNGHLPSPRWRWFARVLGGGLVLVFLAILFGLGVQAARRGHRVAFATAHEWVLRLGAAKRAGRLEAELERLGRIQLLIVDEVGYIPFDPEAGALFFALISSRYERRSLVVSSNKTFSAWAEIFGDPVAVAAMVDRLVHHAEVIVLRGDSYRLKGKGKEVLQPEGAS